MGCNRYSFNLTVGESLLTYLNINNSDLTPINLSGFSCRGKVKFNYSSSDYIYDLNPQISNAVSGILMISGDNVSTQNLPVGSFLYDIEIYNSGGFTLKVLNGDFNITPTTTNF